MLRGGDLIVLGLGQNAELPEFLVQILHERGHARLDGAEIMVVQLLPLRRLRAEERAARVEQVLALIVKRLVDEEIFLLRADRGAHSPDGSVWPKSFRMRRPCLLMACMERSSGVFLSSASPP